MKIVFEEELKGPTGPIGKLGALPRCPKCGAYHLMWDPETDISKCRCCGYENIEEARQNFEKQLARGERSADEAKAYTIRKENAVPFTVDEPADDEWLKKHAEDVEKVMRSNVVMGRLYAAIDEKAAVFRETVEDRILCEWQLKRADVEDALRERDAYRATGLTPEEITAMQHTLDEYHKVADPLLRAQADGRLVVLPCKVGDTVYKVITIQAQKPVLLETQVKTLGQAADVAQLIGKKNKVINIFLTREEAEKALEEDRI